MAYKIINVNSETAQCILVRKCYIFETHIYSHNESVLSSRFMMMDSVVAVAGSVECAPNLV